MNELLELDKQIFLFINQGLSNPITDFMMPVVTSFKYWAPLYIIGFIYLLLRFRLKGLYILFILLFCVGLCDLLNAQILKELFSRVRPCRALENVNLLINCGGGLSFPSNHAVNNFAAAAILSHYFKRKVAVFYTIAVIVSLSRVFVGVHYLSDVALGGLEGFLIGSLIVFIASKFSYDEKVIERIRIN